MIREWRHIRLLKRSGWGHDPSGSRGTKEGECAVLCPACPIPGINLPPDWKERPTTKQYVYVANSLLFFSHIQTGQVALCAIHWN